MISSDKRSLPPSRAFRASASNRVARSRSSGFAAHVVRASAQAGRTLARTSQSNPQAVWPARRSSVFSRLHQVIAAPTICNGVPLLSVIISRNHAGTGSSPGFGVFPLFPLFWPLPHLFHCVIRGPMTQFFSELARKKGKKGRKTVRERPAEGFSPFSCFFGRPHFFPLVDIVDL